MTTMPTQTPEQLEAERIITREVEAGLRTPSGTLVSTIEAMEATGLRLWHEHLRELGSVPWGAKSE